MQAYKTLARSYDRLTEDVDYASFVAFYNEILEKEGLKPSTALEIACGTGSVAILLSRQGMAVTASDISEEMLCMASRKAESLQNPPLFIRQPMQELSLPRAVDLAVCALDGIDYLLEPSLCARTFRRVYRALNPGGCFIFDVNTPEKLRSMDGQVFLDEDEDVYCVWRGEFDEDTNICSYGMDLFQRSGGAWVRSFEEHKEYAYSAKELIGYLRKAGFTRIEVFADRKPIPPRDGEQRIFLKARKGRIL